MREIFDTYPIEGDMNKLFLTVIGFSILSACGGADKPKSSSATFNSVGNGTSLIAGKTLDTSLLGGTWVSSCTDNSQANPKIGGSHLEHYTFYTDGAGIYSTTYSDQNCLTPEISIFSFVSGGASAMTESTSAFTAQYAANSDSNTVYVPMSGSIVSSFNDEGTCGYHDWKLNQPFAVDGTNCALISPGGGSATTVTFTLSADHQSMRLVSCDTSGTKVGQCDTAIVLFRE
jgi:hypothetical protein